jgi:OOP family OmpA-OmpF porin
LPQISNIGDKKNTILIQQIMRDQPMNKNAILLFAGLALSAGSAVAKLDGVVTDSEGKYVIDSRGECVSYGKLKHYHKNGDAKGYCAEPKKAEKPKPMPAPQPTVETITLGAHALFNHDKSNLRPEGMAELDALASKLGQLKSLNSITVVGHTDSSGSDEYNQALSERRANSVKDYLVSKGVDGNKIHASGMGEKQPTTSNATKEGRAQNRRVEITVSGTK